MAKNLKALGEVYDYTATAPVVSGDIVAMNDTVGVALTNGAIGEIIAVRVVGVFDLPKATGAAIAQGKKVYLDTATGNVVGTASGNTYAGKAYVAADSAATTVQVVLNA